jgi:hypothetical protein
MLQPNKDACSAIARNNAGGHECKHGHATTGACFGNSYPSGNLIPVCVRQDKVYDESRNVVTIANWPSN